MVIPRDVYSKKPDDAWQLARQIRDIRLKDPAEAVAFGLEALERFPDNPNVLCSLGYACLKTGDADKAEELFRHALEANPKNEVALNSLAQVSMAKGDWVEAKERFRNTLKVNPENEVALNGLGQVSMDRGNWNDAKKRFQNTLKVNQKNETALNSLGHLYLVRGKLDEAEIQFQRTLKVNQKNYVALNSLGQVSLARGDWVEAEKRFRKALKVNPKDEVANLFTAMIDIHGGRERQAYDRLIPFLQEKPNLAMMWMLETLAVRGMGRETFPLLLKEAGAGKLFPQKDLDELSRWFSEGRGRVPEEMHEIVGVHARSRIFDTPSVIHPVNRVALWDLTGKTIKQEHWPR